MGAFYSLNDTSLSVSTLCHKEILKKLIWGLAVYISTRRFFLCLSGDELVKNILDDSELLDQITDLLNEDPPHPHWRHLAKELKIPQEKCKIFEPTEDVNSPTKLLFKSIERCEPDLTFEELVLALVAMKRQDVLDVLLTYFSSELIFSPTR